MAEPVQPQIYPTGSLAQLQGVPLVNGVPGGIPAAGVGAIPVVNGGPGQAPAAAMVEEEKKELAPIPDIRNSAAYSILQRFRDYDEMNHSLLWDGVSSRTLVSDNNNNNNQNRMNQTQNQNQQNMNGMGLMNNNVNNMNNRNRNNNNNNNNNNNYNDLYNWDVTERDVDQCEAVLDQSIAIIENSIKEFNIRGYGKRDLENDKLYQKEKYNIKGTIISRNNLYQFAEKQVEKYYYEPDANAVVDLVGIAHTTVFHLAKYRPKYRFSIDRHGWCRFNNRKLDANIFFNGLSSLQRSNVTGELINCIEFYLCQKHGFHHYYYPTAEQALMAGIKDTIYNDFFTNNMKTSDKLKQNKDKSIMSQSMMHASTIVRLPYCLYSTKGWEYEIPKFTQFVNANDYRCVRPKVLYNKELYMCVIFPNHKKHLKPGIWSRNVALFDNIVRGTMIPFVEACEDEGWSILMMNSNEHTMKTRGYLNVPPKEMDITIPLSESSKAHCNTLFKYFLKPLIRELDVKLLFVGHFEGCNDIISVIEDNISKKNGNNDKNSGNSRTINHNTNNDDGSGSVLAKNIIGIAMLDYYDFDVSEWSPQTLKLIEQKGAIWHSLYGINQQTYGFEPSPAKQPITTFATANKSERYAPCFNQEAIIRFFKSKIELQKSTMLQ